MSEWSNLKFKIVNLQLELDAANTGREFAAMRANRLQKEIENLEQRLDQAHREGWEQGKAEAQRTIQQLEAMNKALIEHISKGITLQPAPVMMADAAAHRMGWEQGKSEAAKLVEQRRLASDPFHTIADAIATMEYGESK